MFTVFFAHLLLLALAWLPCCCAPGTSSGAAPPPPSSSSPTIEYGDCEGCQANTMALWHRVTIGGTVTNGSCTACANAIGDYICGPTSAAGCNAVHALTPAVCTGTETVDEYELEFAKNAPNFDLILFTLRRSGVVDRVNYVLDRSGTADADGRIDCSLDGADIPYSFSQWLVDGICDPSGSTCTATAIPAP